MKPILVPTDFSKTAANAMEYAAQLCQLTNRGLFVVHVRTEIDNDGTDKLRITAESLAAAFPDLKFRVMTLSGRELAEQIAATAFRLDVDFIVMGTEGESNFEKLVFGSNTSAVIEKSKCKVLSIPFNSPFKQPEKILFATNFEPNDLRIAVDVVNLAKAFNASVIIGHVLTDPEREELEGTRLDIFCRDLMMLTGYQRIRQRVSSENTVAMGLDALIEALHPDVMALSTHRRGLLEKIVNPSITQKFAAHLPIPLLALRAE